MHPEPLVDAQRAAEFLSISRRHLLDLTRSGALPGHPIGNSARRMWRFRLSELADAVDKNVFTSQDDPVIRTPTGGPRRGF
jgi:Helix-turn-helix domain